MRLIRLHADGNQRHKARMMKAQITLICITWRQPPKVSALTPNGGYLRGCAKTEVALRDELSLNLRPRPAEFAAADRPHAKGPVQPCLRCSTLSAA